MALIDDGKIYLILDHATEAELRQGMLAARAAFEAVGVSVDDALDASLKLDMLHDTGCGDTLTETDCRNLEAYETVKKAILAALPNRSTFGFGRSYELFEDDREEHGPQYTMSSDRLKLVA